MLGPFPLARSCLLQLEADVDSPCRLPATRTATCVMGITASVYLHHCTAGWAVVGSSLCLRFLLQPVQPTYQPTYGASSAAPAGELSTRDLTCCGAPYRCTARPAAAMRIVSTCVQLSPEAFWVWGVSNIIFSPRKDVRKPSCGSGPVVAPAAGCTGGHGRGRASNFSKAPPTSAYSGAGPAAPPGAGRGGPPYPAFAQSKVCATSAHTFDTAGQCGASTRMQIFNCRQLLAASC
jgi:hypothetical protein